MYNYFKMSEFTNFYQSINVHQISVVLLTFSLNDRFNLIIINKNRNSFHSPYLLSNLIENGLLCNNFNSNVNIYYILSTISLKFYISVGFLTN